MQNQTKTATSLRSFIPRGTQIGFIVGLILGILLGWIFSGLIGAVVRFGFVAVAMVLLIGAILFWWNTRQRPEGDGPKVYTWTSTSISPNQQDLYRNQNMPRQSGIPQDVIDLEELKREMEREK